MFCPGIAILDIPWGVLIQSGGASEAWDNRRASREEIDSAIKQVTLVNKSDSYTIIIFHADVQSEDVRIACLNNGFIQAQSVYWWKVGQQRKGSKQWNSSVENLTIAFRNPKSLVWNESKDPRLRCNMLPFLPVTTHAKSIQDGKPTNISEKPLH